MGQAVQWPIRYSTASESGVMVSRRSLDQTMSVTGDGIGSVSHEATVRPARSELHKYIKRESNCLHAFIGTKLNHRGWATRSISPREGSMTPVSSHRRQRSASSRSSRYPNPTRCDGPLISSSTSARSSSGSDHSNRQYVADPRHALGAALTAETEAKYPDRPWTWERAEAARHALRGSRETPRRPPRTCDRTFLRSVGDPMWECSTSQLSWTRTLCGGY